MADMERAYTALRNAHAAGDVEAARKLAAYIQQQSEPITPRAKGPQQRYSAMNEPAPPSLGQQLDDAVAELEGPPASVTLGATLRDIPRQVGLTARYGLEAFGQTALPDIIGLPEPQNANERVVGDASRMLVGAGGIAKGAQFLAGASRPVIAGIGKALQANTAGQAAGAIGGGTASGAVREAGGGPTEQFIAAVLGSVAAPGAAAAAMRGIRGGANAVRSAIAPKDISGEITVALERAGIDWSALSREAQVQLVKDAQRAVQSGGELDAAALGRLADYRSIGATPLRGDITQNPRDVTIQRNLAKTQANMDVPAGPDLAGIQNANARTVIGTLKGVETSPADAYATGARGVGTIAARDAQMQATERGLYRAAEESAGRNIQLDREAFVQDAYQRLAQKNKAAFLPGEIQTILNNIMKGEVSLGMHGPKVPVSFDVDAIDNLKTVLATATRGTRDGNVKAAIGLVREALDDLRPSAAGRPTGSAMPVSSEVLGRAQGRADSLSAEALANFDKARAAARGRREWQRSAGFIEDALDGMAPEDWTRKHVLNARVDDLGRLRTEMRNDPEFIAAARKQLLGFVWKRGRVDEGATTFTSAGMRDALEQIGDRKLKLFFDAKEIQQIKAAVNVARSMQSQPIGSAVNNSNSMAMGLGRLFSSLLNAGNKVPLLGPMVAQPLTGASVALQARSASSVPTNALLQAMPREQFPWSPLLALPVAPPRD